MHRIELEILKRFRREPHIELRTSDVVREVLDNEYEQIAGGLHTPLTGEERRRAQRTKDRLHRRVLHHLHKLVADEILSVVRVVEKGEKVFRLALDPGEYLIEKGKRRIVISKPANLSVPSEGYEREGVLAKYEAETWVTRLNAIFLEAGAFNSPQRLAHTTRECFSVVNDVLGLNRFEELIERAALDEVLALIERLEGDAGDYEKRVSIVISLPRLGDEAKMLAFIEGFAALAPERVGLIFNITPDALRKHRRLLLQLIPALAERKIKITIKNSKIHPPIYLLGRAGPYTMLRDDWAAYLGSSRGDTLGAAICQSSMALDLARFFATHSGLANLEDCMVNAAKALLRANLLQRQHAQEYYPILHRLHPLRLRRFFDHSGLYLRLWNYDWKSSDREMMLEMLRAASERVEAFSLGQQTIFKSCGMPMRFRILLSSAFFKFGEELSARVYHKSTIRRLEDLRTPQMREYIALREALFAIFAGGDRIRIFRAGAIEARSILEEWSHLLTTHDLPLITYDFHGLSGDVKLTSFIGP